MSGDTCVRVKANDTILAYGNKNKLLKVCELANDPEHLREYISKRFAGRETVEIGLLFNKNIPPRDLLFMIVYIYFTDSQASYFRYELIEKYVFMLPKLTLKDFTALKMARDFVLGNCSFTELKNCVEDLENKDVQHLFKKFCSPPIEHRDKWEYRNLCQYKIISYQWALLKIFPESIENDELTLMWINHTNNINDMIHHYLNKVALEMIRNGSYDNLFDSETTEEADTKESEV